MDPTTSAPPKKRKRKKLTPEQREAARQKHREWKLRNPEKVKEGRARYRARNRERVLESNRKWRRLNPEKNRAQVARYRAKSVDALRVRAVRRQWRKQNPEKVAALRARHYVRHHERLLAESRVRGLRRTAARRKKLLADIRNAIPPNLPRDVRDDVASSLVLAVLERKIKKRDACKRAKEFVTAHYRGRDWHKTISLETPIPGTDGLRIVDRLASHAVEPEHEA